MSRDESAPVLVADIGGTNCRLALAGADGNALMYRTTTPTSGHPTPIAAFKTYLAGVDGPRPYAAVLALACPIGEGRIKLTNSAWEFCRAEIEQALGMERVLFVNDLEAQAAGVAVLRKDQFSPIGPPPDAPFSGVTAVVGPGTGMGVAAINHEAAKPIMPSEGGHIAFAPETDLEIELLQMWRRRSGHMSREHLLSGPGLLRLYRTMGEMSGQAADKADGAAIVAAALAGNDPVAENAVDAFCGALAAFAGDTALMFNARRVVLVGAIAQSLEPVLQRPAHRARFAHRGPRPRYLEHTPLLIAREADLGLLGARALLAADPQH